MSDWKFNARLLFAALFLISVNSLAIAQLPFETPPINYSKSDPNDPVAALAARVERGDAVLTHHAKTGFLSSLLNELQIPVSSQTLVFSKTSLQRHMISSSNPRAIYFNDETYIGWVPDADLIEIASIDPMLGTNFYTIEQQQLEKPSKLVRKTERCLFCHASSDTGRVPGLMMQSVYTDSDGHRVFPSQSIRPSGSGPIVGRWSTQGDCTGIYRLKSTFSM